MTRRRYSPGVPTTLAAEITASATSFQIDSATGWPSGSGDNFWVTIDAGNAKEERILCTVVSGSSAPYTVTVKGPSYTDGRGKDGTTATSHAAGATVWPSWSATDADEANAHINASTAVHGLSGAVVGTTDSQVLTTKTINLTDNTLTGTTAQFNTALSDANFATQAGTETLTNKTIDLASNTLTGTKAQFNTAISDADFATLTGTETLSNKTITAADFYSYQPTPTSIANTGTTTLTIAQLLTRIIIAGGGSGQTYQLPTGSDTNTGILSGALPTDYAFNWSVYNNTGGTSLTMSGNTNHTYSGNTTVAYGDTAMFRTRKTGSSTFVTYRIS